MIHRIEFNEELHEYKMDGVVYPSVSEVLQDTGFVDDTWFTEFGRERGKAAHKAILYDDQGILDHATLDPRLVPRLEAWRKFKLDMGWVSRMKEQPLACPVLRIAGTPDDIGTHRMAQLGFCIVDAKCGQPMPYHALQLALYAYMLGQLVCVDPADIERIGVHLKADGSYKIKRYTDKKDILVAFSTVSLFHWKRNHNL